MKRVRKPLERVQLIVTYHPGLPPLKSILDKHSSILNVSEKLRQLAVKNPLLVAYQHLPNFKGFFIKNPIIKNPISVGSVCTKTTTIIQGEFLVPTGPL